MVLILSINMLKTRIYAYYFLSWYVQARNMLYKLQICSIIAFCFLQTNIEYNRKLTFDISLHENGYSVNYFLNFCTELSSLPSSPKSSTTKPTPIATSPMQSTPAHTSTSSSVKYTSTSQVFPTSESK